MFQLTNQQIASWRNEDKVYVPNAIDVHCPDCSRLVSFAVPKWHPAPQNIRVGSVFCPGCRSLSVFLLTNFQGKANTLDEKEKLYIDRKPSGRKPVMEILNSQDMGEALQRAYLSSVNVFNSNEWNATAVLTRRLLEGITKSLLDENDQALPLAKQVEKLPSVKDLSEPIVKIADAIRKGGNLGAHFDLEKEADRESAALILELAEELLEYFYVLPERITKLHDAIEKLGKK